MTATCLCDPWAADETCPVHGDDEHRTVSVAHDPDLDRCAHGRLRIDWCTFCPRRYVDGVMTGPFIEPELVMTNDAQITPDPWATMGPVPPPPF
jgi:hypothetical protein